MSTIGKAVKVSRIHVVSPCGFDGLAGYKEDGIEGADAQLSFMPKTTKVTAKVLSLVVKGLPAEVVKHMPSQHIEGMWTFLVNYQEPDQ